MRKKSPAAGSAAAGTKERLNSTSPSYHQNTEPDNAIWDSCREARDADAARRAQAAARLEAAATRLGFVRNEDHGGQWLRECPHCGRKVALGMTRDGDVRASGFTGGPTCAAIPNLPQRLRGEGFSS
jgi:hypothetical protein